MHESINDYLKLGDAYTKKDLAELLNEPSLASVREGVFTCQNYNAILLFVDLIKTGKEDRFHFNDYFDGDNFHWDSQTTQHINSPRIQKIVKGQVEVDLFVRIEQKLKNITQPFLYCGVTHRPSHGQIGNVLQFCGSS